MIRKLPHWINKTQNPKAVHMLELLRDYVLIMANTGMRHGTEAPNLKWQHITQFEDKGQSYLEMSVSGKTGRRDIICRSGTINYLKRTHERSEDIKHLITKATIYYRNPLLKCRIDGCLIMRTRLWNQKLIGGYILCVLLFELGCTQFWPRLDGTDLFRQICKIGSLCGLAHYDSRNRRGRFP